MKLEEAASILGVSLEDITIDGLKQTYKKLAMAWDPEKSSDITSKNKYLQISEAYQKLNSVMEGTDGYKGDDTHEVAAFMRMFMDMVGISESDSIPAAMTFGMMFGSRQNSADEWSTDDDGDCDYDDDEEDEEYLPDEYFNEYAAITNHAHLGGDRVVWDPQVKQFSSLNQKGRVEELPDTDDAGLTEAEREKKQKLAKKRADKRKKQKEKEKEKKLQDMKADEPVALEATAYADLDPEELRLRVRANADGIVRGLVNAIANGQLGKVNQVLSYDLAEEIPSAVAADMIAILKEELPNAPLLHNCITNMGKETPTPSSISLAARRLEVARYLLNFRNPTFDLSAVDSAGLSALHLAISSADLSVAQVIIRAFTEGSAERRSQLNINSRCHKKGWAPIHYAVDSLDLEAVRLLILHGANVVVTMATDKRFTPLEFARYKLKSGGTKVQAQALVQELQVAIDRFKASRRSDAAAESGEKSGEKASGDKAKGKDSKDSKDKESKSKHKEESEVEFDAASVAASINAVSAVASKPSDKKKKKDKKKAEKTPSVPSPPQDQKSAQPSSSGGASAKPAASRSSNSTVTSSSPHAPTPPAPTPAPSARNKKGKKAVMEPIAEFSGVSRDSMVDGLLAMGFREADCLHAISLYGTDMDQAISYLCDLPEPMVKEGKGEKGEGARSRTDSGALQGTPPTPTKGAPAPPTPVNTAKLQREKEELRRINRAWNAKAEDEKRKAEALKQQQEEEKQRELVAQKQQQEQLRQQQMQQQYLYQQHLQQQQFMAIQQQQQHQQQQQRMMPPYFGAPAANTLGAHLQQAGLPAFAPQTPINGGQSFQSGMGLAQGLGQPVGGPAPFGMGSSPSSLGIAGLTRSGTGDVGVGAIGSLGGGGSGAFQYGSGSGLSDVMSGYSAEGQQLLFNHQQQQKAPDWGAPHQSLQFDDMIFIDEEVVDGALELSAGAKPFVPRFDPPSGQEPFGVGAMGGLGLGSSSTPWSTPLDAPRPHSDKDMSSFLSNLLPDLTQDEENFEHMMPDLDSFLLGDN
mmetsp:Transcript_19660/g.42689  ORF Transcript_19660/g.42689 Transcript_19660/m.42689 type:complete len:1034 (-) Transcript_19660:54-3155(-)